MSGSVICAAKKNSMRDTQGQWTSVILYRLINKDLSDKVKIKQRPSEGASHAGNRGKKEQRGQCDWKRGIRVRGINDEVRAIAVDQIIQSLRDHS